MITISKEIIKKQPNFWNNCLFHPTDAVEDSWGKRILDRISEDKAADMVRIYAMLEDIVLMDEDGNLTYDFRVNDLRLDYLHEKGFRILIAYGMMPECIAKDPKIISPKIRYKGKDMITSPPKTPELWEEVCYQYTKHIVERYGIDTVSTWRMQCFNEPDWKNFFMSNLEQGDNDPRLEEYKVMYAAFAKGTKRVSEKVQIGGPSLARDMDFFRKFLTFVKENNIPQDFISVHNYGTGPEGMNDGTKPINVENNIVKMKSYLSIIDEVGLSDKKVIVDEWGGAGGGFMDIKYAPGMIFRETEVYASYFTKLIARSIEEKFPIEKMLICLSGQNEKFVTEDFTGFRNFFTLNFIAKPIYNAYVMSGRLKENLLSYSKENENIYVIPTKAENGYSIMLTYSNDLFEEIIPELDEKVVFEENLVGKNVTVYCIDREHTNPFRVYENQGTKTPNEEQLRELRAAGKLVNLYEGVLDSNEITLKLTANCTYLIEVK
ncbi:MAG: hypothetical protein IJD91_07075 [Clostridia bacterium]|nr:hypothetical protein [Clostridia bacterium]